MDIGGSVGYFNELGTVDQPHNWTSVGNYG